MLTEDFNKELQTTSQILQLAADGAKAGDIRKPSTNHLRASRAGLPLVQLVLEDLILPKIELELNTPKQKTDTSFHMRIGSGHLFEAAVGLELGEKYQSVINNATLDWKNIEGHCDYLAFDPTKSKVHVYECKSLNVYGIKDAKDKVLYDNWGYYTQLSLYYSSVLTSYAGSNVSASWLVWCKKSGKMIEIPYPEVDGEPIVTANHAVRKSSIYVDIYSLLKAGDIDKAIDILWAESEELPERVNTGTNFYNSCGLHFHWSSGLLVDKKEGHMLDSAHDNLRVLANAAYGQDDSKAISLSTVKLLLDNRKKVR